MKNLKFKISALAVLAIVAIGVTFTSCQKDAQIESPEINNSQSNNLPRAAGITILGLTIDYGTRKGARKNREADERNKQLGFPPSNFDDGTICQNKGICLHTSNGIEITTDDENHVIIGDDVIEGGLLLAVEGQEVTEGSGRWNLSKDDEGAYFVEIGPDDILPATKEVQFGDGYYYQEFDYILPSFISDYFGGEEIILHRGEHPITEDENGTIKFYL